MERAEFNQRIDAIRQRSLGRLPQSALQELQNLTTGYSSISNLKENTLNKITPKTVDILHELADVIQSATTATDRSLQMHACILRREVSTRLEELGLERATSVAHQSMLGVTPSSFQSIAQPMQGIHDVAMSQPMHAPPFDFQFQVPSQAMPHKPVADDVGPFHRETPHKPEPSPSGQLGLVSWNVAHYSDKDVPGQVEALTNFFEKFPIDQVESVLELAEQRSQFLVDARAETRPVRTINRIFKGDGAKEEDVLDTKSTFKKLRELKEKWSPDLLDQCEKDLSARVRVVDLAKQLSRLKKELDKVMQVLGLLDKGTCKVLGFGAAELKTASSHKSFPKHSFMDQLQSTFHSRLVELHVADFFALPANAGIDCVGLQEVNNITGLVGGGKGRPYQTCAGPRLIAHGGDGQVEYYPLLLRPESGLQVHKVHIVGTDGEIQTRVAKGRDPATQYGEYVWEKESARFRPIVVYELSKRDQSKFLIGVVHTSPEADRKAGMGEFRRAPIYAQVREPLTVLKSMAEKANMPLMVIGDYYLTPEAIVGTQGTGQNLNAFERESMEEAIPLIQQEIDERIGILKQLLDLGEFSDDPIEEAKVKESIRFLEDAKREEHIWRNIDGLTFEAQMAERGLTVATSATGTNWKKKHHLELEWVRMQIADFMVTNLSSDRYKMGLMHPSGGIEPADSEDKVITGYGLKISDHLAVGALVALNEEEGPLGGPPHPRAVQLAVISNRNRFARKYLKAQGEAVEKANGSPTEDPLQGLSERQIELYALEFLNKWLEGNSDAPQKTLADALSRARDLNPRLSSKDQLLFTDPGDFEGYFGSATEYESK